MVSVLQKNRQPLVVSLVVLCLLLLTLPRHQSGPALGGAGDGSPATWNWNNRNPISSQTTGSADGRLTRKSRVSRLIAWQLPGPETGGPLPGFLAAAVRIPVPGVVRRLPDSIGALAWRPAELCLLLDIPPPLAA